MSDIIYRYGKRGRGGSEPSAPQIQTERSNRIEYTPQEISISVVNFFKQLEQNEERFRASRSELLEKAIKEEVERKKVEGEIKKQLEAEELQKREDVSKDGFLKLESVREFRKTLEYFIESGNETMKDTARRFIASNLQIAGSDPVMPT